MKSKKCTKPRLHTGLAELLGAAYVNPPSRRVLVTHRMSNDDPDRRSKPKHHGKSTSLGIYR